MTEAARQLTFALAPAAAPTFANFVTGPNAEAVTTLRRCASVAGGDAAAVVVLWGAPGAGKSHLLQAAVAAARTAGRAASYVAAPASLGDATIEASALVAIDDVDRADASAQAKLFTLFNALAAQEGRFLAAAAAPPASLALRDDLRTRLGWGLVYEVRPLSDAEKPMALAAYARERGFTLPDDAIAYLLAHGRRDMASLVGTLAALDAHSLALRRPITVPLIRDWLQRDIGLGTPAPPA
jgi:DnaA family protein